VSDEPKDDKEHETGEEPPFSFIPPPIFEAPKRTAPVGFRKPGRSKVFTTAKKNLFLKSLESGMYRAQSATLIGISEAVYQKEMTTDPDFKDDVHRAELKAYADAVDCITREAKKNWKAALAYLQRRDPKNWGSKTEFSMTDNTSATKDVAAAVMAKLMPDEPEDKVEP